MELGVNIRFSHQDKIEYKVTTIHLMLFSVVITLPYFFYQGQKYTLKNKQ